MPVERRWRAVRKPRRDDSGFSLIEAVVAITIIGVVMSALTSVIVNVSVVTIQQGGRQTAIKLATDGIDDVRDKKNPTVDPGTGAWKDLPVENQSAFARKVLVEKCWRSATGSNQSCGTTSTTYAFVRLTVTVTWTDKSCPGSVCTESASTLMNVTADTTILPATMSHSAVPAGRLL